MTKCFDYLSAIKSSHQVHNNRGSIFHHQWIIKEHKSKNHFSPNRQQKEEVKSYFHHFIVYFIHFLIHIGAEENLAIEEDERTEME